MILALKSITTALIALIGAAIGMVIKDTKSKDELRSLWLVEIVYVLALICMWVR